MYLFKASWKKWKKNSNSLKTINYFFRKREQFKAKCSSIDDPTLNKYRSKRFWAYDFVDCATRCAHDSFMVKIEGDRAIERPVLIINSFPLFAFRPMYTTILDKANANSSVKSNSLRCIGALSCVDFWSALQARRKLWRKLHSGGKIKIYLRIVLILNVYCTKQRLRFLPSLRWSE